MARILVAAAVLLLFQSSSASAAKLSVGGVGACAVRADQRVICWGEVGSWLADDRARVRLKSRGGAVAPHEVAGLAGAKGVAVRADSACAVAGPTATVWCWGASDSGEGDGTSVPVEVAGPVGVRALAAGRGNVCAVDGDRRVWCWGDNSAGQLAGFGDVYSEAPVRIAGVSSARSISVGSNHVCASTLSGRVFCWGDNERHQVSPRGTTVRSPRRVAVPVAAEVAAGASGSCSRSTANGVWCWGRGGVRETRRPEAVAGLGSVRSLSLGGDHACALVAGKARCWGSRAHGALGMPSGTPSVDESSSAGGPLIVPTPIFVTRPHTVPKVSRLSAIAAGAAATCALESSGRVWCWGRSSIATAGLPPEQPWRIDANDHPVDAVDPQRVL